MKTRYGLGSLDGQIEAHMEISANPFTIEWIKNKCATLVTAYGSLLTQMLSVA